MTGSSECNKRQAAGIREEEEKRQQHISLILWCKPFLKALGVQKLLVAKCVRKTYCMSWSREREKEISAAKKSFETEENCWLSFSALELHRKAFTASGYATQVSTSTTKKDRKERNEEIEKIKCCHYLVSCVEWAERKRKIAYEQKRDHK